MKSITINLPDKGFEALEFTAKTIYTQTPQEYCQDAIFQSLRSDLATSLGSTLGYERDNPYIFDDEAFENSWYGEKES